METKRVGAPKKPPEEYKQPVALRLTPAQAAKYKELGGGKWVRKLLDAEIAKDDLKVNVCLLTRYLLLNG